MSISRAAFIAVLALILGGDALSGQSRYFSEGTLQRLVNGLDVVDLQGRRWTMGELRGRVVLIEFWAAWCAPCLDQIPLLRELRASHGADRFEVIGVSLDSATRRDMLAWINRQALPWPIVHDGRAFNGRVATAFGVRALPASLVVDASGRIVAENLRGEGLRRAIDSLVQRTSTSSLDAARIPIVIR